MRDGRDLLELIEDAHERIDGLLDSLSEAVGKTSRVPSPTERRRLLHEVAGRLHALQEAEERTLYKRLDPGLTDVRDGLRQHRHLERLVRQLQRLSADSHRWERRAWTLVWSAELHFQHEEEEVFEIARQSLDAELLHRLAAEAAAFRPPEPEEE